MATTLDETPDGLATALDERMHVELGPARARNRAPALMAVLTVVYGVAGILLTFGNPLGITVLIVGTLAIATARMALFWWTEAPMRLSWDEHRLLLQRHFRDRVLWRKRLGWGELASVEREQFGDLELILRSGRRFVLSAAFRSEDQLVWITSSLQEAHERHRSFARSIEGSEQRAALDVLLTGLDRR